MRTFSLRIFPLLFLVLFGCGDNDQPTVDEQLRASPVSFDQFFADDAFAFVRLEGWSKNLMTPGSLADFKEVKGARALIAAADPDSDIHCPDAEISSQTLLHDTPDFKIKTSGNFTKGLPKSSFTIRFTDKDAQFLKMRDFNLKSMWNDVSQMREAIAWRLFRLAKVPASRHGYAKFCINEKYYGLYSIIEEVDKAFLKRRFGDHDAGNLYKANWIDKDLGPATLAYRKDKNGDDSGKQYKIQKDIGERTYELETNEDTEDDPKLQSYDDLAAFIRVINGVGLPSAPDRFNTEAYQKSVEAIFDVRGFLRWASINVLLGAWDNYYATPSNYYLYNAGKGDPKDFMAKPFFHFIPWDYDNSMGIDYFNVGWHNGDIVDWEPTTSGYYKGKKTADLPLVRNILKNKVFLAYYLDHVEFLLENFFTEDWLNQQIGEEGTGGLWDRVRTAAFLESDTPHGAAHTGRQFTNDMVFHNGFRHHQLQNGQQFSFGMLHYMKMRRTSALGQLKAIRKKTGLVKGSSGEVF